jgi:hypothetical protein
MSDPQIGSSGWLVTYHSARQVHMLDCRRRVKVLDLAGMLGFKPPASSSSKFGVWPASLTDVIAIAKPAVLTPRRRSR